MKRLHTALLVALVLLGTLIASTTVAAGTAPAAGSGALEGVYRVSWTETQMIAAGATHAYAHGNHGTLTWTLKAGTFSLDFTVPPICRGTYTVSGQAVAIKELKGCSGRVAARWTVSSRRLSLRVTQSTDPGDRILFGGKPWRKVG